MLAQSCCLRLLILLLLFTSICSVPKKSLKYFRNRKLRERRIKLFGTKKTEIQSLLISTWNYTDANLQAWSVLQQGHRRTRQAVIQGCMACQNQRCGLLLAGRSSPDTEGALTLEAAIMDGESLEYGAVAGMDGVRNAILVADAVLKYTKHSVLVGKSATKFARSLGYKEEYLTDARTKNVLKKWSSNGCQPNFWRDVHPSPAENCGPYSPLPEHLHQHPMHQEYAITQGQHDQLAFLALDAEGKFHVASQSSGAQFRIPGRVGDSAVPGAGIYADNEVGGAVASGDGDVLMRHLPAFLAVEAMRAGKDPDQAAEWVVQRLLRHNTEFNGAVVVVNRRGIYAAACAGLDEFNFVVSGGKEYLSMARVERVKCLERENEVIDGGPKGLFPTIPEKQEVP
ncbi:L-asparaginase-like protein GM15681 [Drosophila sechellia]|uniref:L-asparaginase-like protein GM15681 n=1 Tax=Drosophila sechellia TaxID=7238 RepID=ASPG2_DROSE|nr:L-asparaginase-like protein GM15681 [Drosophila sechellia]B4I7X1.1 RecName: Full=L-asparaginase-like protein GM15681; Flags: Precursor [Drosophila sechellia]EDW56696.1 GM15681 [Drosophila sechellia]